MKIPSKIPNNHRTRETDFGRWRIIRRIHVDDITKLNVYRPVWANQHVTCSPLGARGSIICHSYWISLILIKLAIPCYPINRRINQIRNWRIQLQALNFKNLSIYDYKLLWKTNKLNQTANYDRFVNKA